MEPNMDDFADLLLDDYDINDPTEEVAQNNPASTETEIKKEGEKKIPKKKLDENLLLDENGLTLLRAQTAHLKFKGKGHEDEDLKKLMTYYTVWANNLFPKYNFQDFAIKVAKPASSARVKTVLNEWKNEFIDRRNIRLGIRQELSENNAEDREQQQPVEEDESSEDDNRPLFFPITTPTKKTKPKQKKQAPKRQASDDDEEEDDEEPLFNRGTKRRLIGEKQEEEEEEETPSMNRENALALLAKRRQEREIAQRAQELKRKEEELERARMELQKPIDDIMDDYQDLTVDTVLSDNELEALNIPTIDKSKEAEEAGFSDNELIEDIDTNEF